MLCDYLHLIITGGSAVAVTGHNSGEMMMRSSLRSSWTVCCVHDVYHRCAAVLLKDNATCLIAAKTLERCNPWPHVAIRHISISQLLSLWRHSHYDVIRDWAGHARPALRTYTLRTDTLPRLIYKDEALPAILYRLSLLAWGEEQFSTIALKHLSNSMTDLAAVDRVLNKMMDASLPFVFLFGAYSKSSVNTALPSGVFLSFSKATTSIQVKRSHLFCQLSAEALFS